MTDQEFSDRIMLMLKKNLHVEYSYKVYEDDPTPKIKIFYGDIPITECETEFSIYD